MESLPYLTLRVTPRVSFQTSRWCRFCKFFQRRSVPFPEKLMASQRGTNISIPCIRAEQPEWKEESVPHSSDTISEVDALKIKEWGEGRWQDEIAATECIKIRRRRPQSEGSTPRNILEDIVWNKDVEVSRMKKENPLSALKNDLERVSPTRDFIGALKDSILRTGSPALIAEVKKASPSRGVMRKKFYPVEIAKAYEKGGAACLSVLADREYFQGSFENIIDIRNAGVQCPLLCKEFIIDEWQIYYARTKGADAILLIAAVLPDFVIKYMTKICKLLGLTALVEVHNEREMDRVLEIDGIELIGINNRDLETFNVDISNTKKLLQGDRGQRIRQKDIIVVAESGLFTPANIAYVQQAGARAVLVGESIVKQNDLIKGITELYGRDISC